MNAPMPTAPPVSVSLPAYQDVPAAAANSRSKASAQNDTFDFDASTVPLSSLLFRNQVPLQVDPCRVKCRTTANGNVVSSDSRLDHDAEELWKFLLAQLQLAPQLRLHVVGSHREKKVPEGCTGVHVEHCPPIPSHGHSHHRQHHHHHHQDHHHGHPGHSHHNHHHHNHHQKEDWETVTDFDFTLDVTHLVSCEWQSVAVQSRPTKKRNKKHHPSLCPGDNNEACPHPTLRDVLESYAESDSRVKELQMRKQLVGWNLSRLEHNLELLLRQQWTAHFHCESICVSFLPHGDRVYVRSSSWLSRMLNNACVQILCVLSCLWICFASFFCCKKGTWKEKVVASYPMLVSEQEFYQRNANVILGLAQARVKHGSYQAV